MRTRLEVGRDKPVNLELWTWYDSWFTSGPVTAMPFSLVKSVFDNVLFEHGGLPYVLFLVVQFSANTKGYTQGQGWYLYPVPPTKVVGWNGVESSCVPYLWD